MIALHVNINNMIRLRLRPNLLLQSSIIVLLLHLHERENNVCYWGLKIDYIVRKYVYSLAYDLTPWPLNFFKTSAKSFRVVPNECILFVSKALAPILWGPKKKNDVAYLKTYCAVFLLLYIITLSLFPVRRPCFCLSTFLIITQLVSAQCRRRAHHLIR